MPKIQTLGLFLIFIYFIFALFIIGFLSVAYLQFLHLCDVINQHKRIKILRQQKNENSIEHHFTVSGIDKNTPFNEIKFIATHNSHKKLPSKLALAFLHLHQKNIAKQLSYQHENLWNQLNSGIRSFELDIRHYSRKILVNHVPLVDNRTTSPLFKYALEEIFIWSKQHPNHFPITVLLELKNDYRILAPFSKPVNLRMLELIEDNILEVFPTQNIFKPDDLRIHGMTLEQSIKKHGWPSLQEMKGKVIFLLHKDPILIEYEKKYHNLQDSYMFITKENMDEGSPFLLMNNPYSKCIKKAVEQNYIIRTRADEDLNNNKERHHKALASGAQIISTDYPPGNNFIDPSQVLSFGNNKTISRSLPNEK
ncbi:MAG: phosphatidylinositol-specific phospholipase C1-like protein [Spirochaetales bacterium]|nr:phosphatidylinositol-specific phospholipase C1-like protein [Spirochaetales bacterium]